MAVGVRVGESEGDGVAEAKAPWLEARWGFREKCDAVVTGE